MRLRVVPKTRGMAPVEAAAFWIVRQDRGDLSPTELAEFQDWFADPRNADAYARAARATDTIDPGAGADPHLKALWQSALELAPAPSPAPRWRGLFAIAAALVLLLAGAVLFLSLERAPGGSPAVADARPQAPVRQARATPDEHATGIGERRVVRLPDGTRVTLNTRSRLVLAFSPERRLVRLVQGQALFEVAHDRARPFTVEAADRQVTALGTIFEVRVDPGRIHVVLIEGRVVVDRPAALAGSAPTIPIAPAILRPGQEYVAELGAAQQIARVDVNRSLMWRDGFVEFDDEPLGRAVAEMNRYTDRPILLGNDGVAALRISGVFRTGNPDRFVNTIGEILPIEARATERGRIELSLSGSRAR